MGNGLHSVGNFFGITGDQGDYYQGTPPPKLRDYRYDSQAWSNADKRAQGANSAQTQQALQDYSSGKLSYQDALKQALSGQAAGEQAGITDQFAIDPMTGSKLATENVQNDAILGKIFGQGGLQDRTLASEKELAGRGYSLQPEDYEAYGQAQGDIARMFGGQEQSLAQSLAQRGLASDSNGAALSGYAGLNGNKFEQLAGVQRQIANDRMQTNMKRLNDTRNQLNTMTGQGGEAIQQQYGRQLAGVKQGTDTRQKMIDSDQAGANAYNTTQANLYGTEAADRWQSTQNQQQNKGIGLGQAFGAGLTSGVYGEGQKTPGSARQGLGSFMGGGK